MGLDHLAKNIRLLRFGDIGGDGINCTLTTYDIADCPLYVCLSYAWGDPNSPQEKIILNNREFLVRQNL